MIRIVGLGPGDPGLLTLGSRESLRAVGRAATVLAPPELVRFLESDGITIERTLITDQGLFLRGSSEVIDTFADRVDERDLGLSSGAGSPPKSCRGCRGQRSPPRSRCR